MSESLVDRYKDECPSIREPLKGEKSCSECCHYEGCTEVDACCLHQLYHDWDMPESINFVGLICDDFKESKEK